MASSRPAATRAHCVSCVALSRQCSSRLLWAGLVASPAAAGPPGPGGIVSDEFTGGIVEGPVWHFVDPLGDSSLTTGPVMR